ncbi:MAG: type II toxin-antitoxin system prevent-host-death family antitoxin [Actinomycetaceae bacterium]|nr:type II toxin-antitoxin system prevent-host-death family antitoxin [Actinomycetaceae bacterium]
MASVTLSEFRLHLSMYIDRAQGEPIEITSRGEGRCAVLVSPDFFDQACLALEDQEDIRATELARHESTVPHADVAAEFGL